MFDRSGWAKLEEPIEWPLTASAYLTALVPKPGPTAPPPRWELRSYFAPNLRWTQDECSWSPEDLATLGSELPALHEEWLTLRQKVDPRTSLKVDRLDRTHSWGTSPGLVRLFVRGDHDCVCLGGDYPRWPGTLGFTTHDELLRVLAAVAYCLERGPTLLSEAKALFLADS